SKRKNTKAAIAILKNPRSLNFERKVRIKSKLPRTNQVTPHT
ncbi:unnamed protein product, partial [marine sediment metagenome]